MNGITDKNMQQKISILQGLMAEMPQAPEMVTDHFFANGMYCRRIKISKDHIVASKVHKTEHFFIGCEGDLLVAGEGENYVLSPGSVVVSPVGTKRLVMALTNVVVMTVHRVSTTDLAKLEEELVASDGPNFYDVNNKPKEGVLVFNKYPLLAEDV